MIYELIHTSWPKGLRSGTSGYTPVAYTEGMPARYITLCESLSGYTHLYPLGHPHYHQNPIAYSHYRFKVDDRPVSVLSRVASAGVDYSGRENKLAHHILVEHDGHTLYVNCGPAWAMLHGALFYDQWEDAPHLLPQDRIHFPSVSIMDEEFKARTWKRMFGDAGPAGRLAQSALEWPQRPSFIVFDPKPASSLCLQLIVEAMMLLPPERRWEVTFNTYFVTKPMDSNCLWRCCVKGAEDPPSLKRYPGALVFDPGEKSDHDEENSPAEEALIRCAQRGILPPWAKDALNRLESTIPLEEDRQILSNVDYGRQPTAKDETLPSTEDQVQIHPQSSNGFQITPHDEIDFKERDLGGGPHITDREGTGRDQKRSMMLFSGVMIAGLIVMLLFWGQWSGIWDSPSVGVPENGSEKRIGLAADNTVNGPTLPVKGPTLLNFEDIKQQRDDTQKDAKMPVTVLTDGNAIVKSVPETIFAIPLSNLVLQFYHSANRLKGISHTTDLGMLRCQLMTPDQEEMAVAIERPVTLDTQNWEMTIAEAIHGPLQTKGGVVQTKERLDKLAGKGGEGWRPHISRDRKGSKLGDRVGYLSLRKMVLYHPTDVSALLFQADQHGTSNYIWVSPVRIDPSRLIPQKLPSEKDESLDNENEGTFDGEDTGKWQLVVGSEYPDLLRFFLSIIEKNEMTGSMDLIEADSNGVGISHHDPIAVTLERRSGMGEDQRPAFIISFTLPHGENGDILYQWENSIHRANQGHENIGSDGAEADKKETTESQISSKKAAAEKEDDKKSMILKKITILHKTDQGEEIPIFVIQ